jgi:hypothetical protein
MSAGPSVWTCATCGKLCFLSKRDAKKGAAAVDRKCRPYKCPADAAIWHFGHLPTAVRMGDFDRHKLRQMRGQNL